MLTLIQHKKSRRTANPRKHQAILRAAAKLFLKHGYGETTMEQVAELSGVTKQTIYSHFGSKDALFRTIIEEQCQKHSPSATLLENMHQPLAEMLFHLGLGFLHMISSPEGLAIHRIVMAEAERKPALAKLFYETGPQRMNDLLTRYLDAQNAHGRLKIANTASAASYFYSMLKGRYHLRMALKVKPLPTPKELEDHVRETVRVFLRIYEDEAPLVTQDVMN
jgi:TetR/AcrR family transcriptional repressor of mexJK operon